jgi:hypothetical protein
MEHLVSLWNIKRARVFQACILLLCIESTSALYTPLRVWTLLYTTLCIYTSIPLYLGMLIVTVHAYPLGLCYCSVRIVTIYELSHYTYISYDLGILLYPDRHYIRIVALHVYLLRFGYTSVSGSSLYNISSQIRIFCVFFYTYFFTY